MNTVASLGAGYSPIGFTPVTPTGATASFPAPPAAPDYSGLLNEQKALNKRTNKQVADTGASYDDLYASTLASGSQAASTAGAAYASRELQAGVNPIASGVVAAQAKLPVYDSLGQITTQKNNSVNDIYEKASGLDFQIQNSVAQLRDSYAKTLAGYNSQIAGYNKDLSTFNAGQATQTGQFNASTAANVEAQNNSGRLAYANLAAQLASEGGGTSTAGSKIGGIAPPANGIGGPASVAPIGSPSNPLGSIPDQGRGKSGYLNPNTYVNYF